jgi:hypothetical protein
MKPESVAGLAPLALALFLVTGCSRQPSVLASNQNGDHEQQLPFDGAANKSGVSPTASLPLADIPAGTSLTVRLRSAVSSATSEEGDAFSAVLDEPISVEGQVILPRGASVTGRVIAAKPSEGPEEPGYLRLTLTTISLRGHPLSLETSSVFLKGGSAARQTLMATGAAPRVAGDNSTVRKDVEFPADRRLIFRLTRILPVQ